VHENSASAPGSNTSEHAPKVRALGAKNVVLGANNVVLGAKNVVLGANNVRPATIDTIHTLNNATKLHNYQ
jgi:hypothetical protein